MQRITSAARFLLALAALALLLPTAIVAQSTPIEGAWVIQSWQDADGQAMDNNQPGLFVFTKTHYSMMFLLGSEPRTPIESQDAEQIVAAYGPFVANSGRYEVDGDQIKTLAFVAKDPGYMGGWPENEVTHTFRIVDGMLHLTFGGNPGAGATVIARQVDEEPGPGSN